MKLMTNEIEKSLPTLYSQECVKDPMVRVKYFCPWNNWVWYGYEYNPEQKLFFGYVKGEYNELGYFSLSDIEEMVGPMGLKIERDLYFSPTPLSRIKRED